VPVSDSEIQETSCTELQEIVSFARIIRTEINWFPDIRKSSYNIYAPGNRFRPTG
jgi:hypothetical protein